MNISLHRRVMLSVLQKIYKNSTLGPQLGFKGGTSLYFLYNLNRFSVDLDFNLVSKKVDLDVQAVEKILTSELQLNDTQEKHNGWIWNGIYKSGAWNMKIEISKRQFEDEYERKDLLGLPLQVMKLEHQLAHKLCAITDRNVLANRDIFDVHFLLQKHISIVDSIIEQRMGVTTKEYLSTLLHYVPTHRSKRGLLDNLGQLIDENQKNWVRESLESELLFLIRSRIEEY